LSEIDSETTGDAGGAKLAVADIAAIAYSPDGTILATASMDTTVKLSKLPSGENLHTLFYPQNVLAVAFDKEGDRVAAGGGFDTVQMWDVQTGSVINDFQAHWNGVNSLVFDPIADSLITASTDNSVRIWPLADLPKRSSQDKEPLRPMAIFNVYFD
jgi:WD40 repeat protein